MERWKGMIEVNVASVSSCRQLHDLLGDDADDHDMSWYLPEGDTEWKLSRLWFNTLDYKKKTRRFEKVPAYHIGHLMRILPDHDAEGIHATFNVGLVLGGPVGKWIATWECDTGDWAARYASTPEDALCKLSIELCRRGLIGKAHAKES